MKRFLSLILSVALLLTCVSFVFQKTASADTFDTSKIYEPYYILVNAETPSKSYRGIEKEADKQVYPASTTKILTCI